MKRLGAVRAVSEGGGHSYSDEGRVIQTVVLTPVEVGRFWLIKRRERPVPRRWRCSMPRTWRRLGSFQDALIERGLVQAPGCRCRHCLNDWDCCGRMVPGAVLIERIGRLALRVTQPFSRNV